MKPVELTIGVMTIGVDDHWGRTTTTVYGETCCDKRMGSAMALVAISGALLLL
jgi:hypothetical protein